MRLLQAGLQLVVVALSSQIASAASWTFVDASVTVQGKGAGVGGAKKDTLNPNQALTKHVQLGESDSLKVTLTTQDGKAAKRPHQAFLLLSDSSAGLDISYPLSVKENGKAKIDLTQKDLPSQFLREEAKINARIVLGSFGSSAGYDAKAFDLDVVFAQAQPAASKKSLRYGKLPEIHHVFRGDQKQPNFLISLVFAIGAFAAIPVLISAWLFLGGNVNHFQKAMNDAPIAHALFIGSIVGLEGILFLYYSSWNLFQTLPALFVVGLVTFVSGSRALTEVQDRRLAGLR